MSNQRATMVADKPTKTMTGAEAVVQCLLAERVETLFGYPGGAIMPVYDAFYDFRDTMHHVPVSYTHLTLPTIYSV